MNLLYMLFEIIIVFSLLIVFYKIGKKDGLYSYIYFMSSILSILIFKSIDILKFEVNIGMSVIIAIFLCFNIIIQKYGLDEVKKIIISFLSSFLITSLLLNLITILPSSEYNYVANSSFDSLFGYKLYDIRIIVGYSLSISFMFWYNAYVYYWIRKAKNDYVLSNIGSLFIIQFLESIIFVFISYLGMYDFDVLIGMISIRYLVKIVIGLIGLIPVNMIMKMKV